jgi:hypothetical protein
MRILILGAAVLLSLAATVFYLMTRSSPQDDGWTTTFHIEPWELDSKGANPWFSLEPGHSVTLEDAETRLDITVLDEVRVIEGIETRVVEERESKNGKLVEVSRNFFAMSRRTNSVFYFGEEVDIYREGRVVGHEGAWESGVDGAHFGLMMPGLPLLHGRYYQEIATGIAMDRAEVVRLDDTLTAGDGRLLADLLRIEESSPLEPGVRETKLYAPGIGLVRDGSLRFTATPRTRPPAGASS